MRVKNITSEASNQAIFSMLALFLLFSFVDIFILHIVFSSTNSISESFALLNTFFSDATFGMKLLYIALFIFPFFWLYFLIIELNTRTVDEIYAHNTEDFIKHIDFEKNRINIAYLNTERIKEISYRRIDHLEIVIDTCVAYNKYGPYSAIKGAYINIKSGDFSCSIQHSPINLSKIYKIIYYSQFVKNFSYSFTGGGEVSKETLGKVFEDFISNNYKKTLRTHAYSSVNPIIVTIIYVSIFVWFFIFLSSLFK